MGQCGRGFSWGCWGPGVHVSCPSAASTECTYPSKYSTHILIIIYAFSQSRYIWYWTEQSTTLPNSSLVPWHYTKNCQPPWTAVCQSLGFVHDNGMAYNWTKQKHGSSWSTLSGKNRLTNHTAVYSLQIHDHVCEYIIKLGPFLLLTRIISQWPCQPSPSSPGTMACIPCHAKRTLAVFYLSSQQGDFTEAGGGISLHPSSVIFLV